MKKELEKLYGLYDERNNLENVVEEALEKNSKGGGMPKEIRDAEKELLSTERKIWEEEKRIFGEYFVGLSNPTGELEEYTKGEWEAIIDLFKESVLKIEAVSGDRGLSFGFINAALSKACSDLWND